MLMSPDSIKEQGLDKASTQLRTQVFLKLVGDAAKRN
jgi:hypothetical protein